MKRLTGISLAAAFALSTAATASDTRNPEPAPVEAVNAEADGKLADGLYAVIDTNRGKIVLRLHYKRTPLTVTNFVGLAEGTKRSNRQAGGPFYDDMTFHRVVDGFVIQSGDPRGNGTGGPGYQFEDEFHADLKHTGAGILSMANSGPNTNGSQFFITHGPTKHLDNLHTVFGQVARGQDVVSEIKKGDAMNTVRIRRIGTEAEAFTATQKDFEQAQIRHRHPKAAFTDSGIGYLIDEPGKGEGSPAVGARVTVHYRARIYDTGEEFANTREQQQPYTFVVGKGRTLKAWDETLPTMTRGEHRTIFVPPELAYGAKGRPPLVPGNQLLVFEIELLDFK
ncbi:MAG TPA: peptidylprolyl isomerase [Lentisphaeria bacterium]|nr:peptidylprolyl isomerase [Lentisphaeria bacterium]